jgi:hypothetical protein
MWPKHLVRVVVGLLVVVLAGCGEDPSGPGPGGNGNQDPPDSGAVDAEELIRALDSPLRFDSPKYADAKEALLEIRVPVTVIWRNEGGLPHSVTPVGHTEFPEGISTRRGETILTHTFMNPGRFEYICKFHADLGMRGTIMVY